MNLNKGYFIIGTDTGVGKTYVSTLLYKSLKGKNVGYYKPIQSGCIEKNGKLIAPDVEFLCQKNGMNYDEKMVTYPLKAEVSPHLAFEKEKINVDIEKIYSHYEKLKKQHNYLIVEGAGGLYVPIIRGKFYIFDLIKKMNLPVILVCSSKVGTINHTILTLEELKRKNIKVGGLVFNKVSKNLNYYEKDNINVILDLSKINNYLVISDDEIEIENEKIMNFLNI